MRLQIRSRDKEEKADFADMYAVDRRVMYAVRRRTRRRTRTRYFAEMRAADRRRPLRNQQMRLPVATAALTKT